MKKNTNKSEKHFVELFYNNGCRTSTCQFINLDMAKVYVDSAVLATKGEHDKVNKGIVMDLSGKVVYEKK